MTDKMNKLNENQLEQVVGGKKRYVQNDAGANVRSGPGTDYSKWYHMDEGDVCYTNGERVYSRADGYDWVQRLPNSFLCPDSPCLSMSYINLYHQGTIIYT